MSILDINKCKKTAIIYIFISLFVFIFSLIYEHFSHEVYSKYMLYSSLIPLILGSVINYIVYLVNIKIYIINYNIHNSLILCLTLGFLLKGALDIYGTTNQLLIIYQYISVVLIFINILIILKNINKLIHS